MADIFEIDMNSMASFRKMLDKMATAKVDVESVMATIPAYVKTRVKVAVISDGPKTLSQKPVGNYLEYNGRPAGRGRFIITISGNAQERAVGGGFSKGDFLLTGRKRGPGLIRPRSKKALKLRGTGPNEGFAASAKKSSYPGVASQVRAIAVDVVKGIVIGEIRRRTGLGPRGGSRRVTTGGKFTGGSGRGTRARDRVTGKVTDFGQGTPGLEGASYRGPRG